MKHVPFPQGCCRSHWLVQPLKTQLCDDTSCSIMKLLSVNVTACIHPIKSAPCTPTKEKAELIILIRTIQLFRSRINILPKKVNCINTTRLIKSSHRATLFCLAFARTHQTKKETLHILHYTASTIQLHQVSTKNYH